ncbi:hypothetical protein BJV78DRAFT_1158706 [Lactifluus subvellereus]|nr:hypothetical protein BJV78DRAFT_1158706 [Lactifluus subvellereus]
MAPEGKALFWPIKRSGCWVSEAEVAMLPMHVHEREFRALTRYSERSEEQYPTGHSEVEELKLKRRRQDHGTERTCGDSHSDGRVQHRTHTGHTCDYNTARIPAPTFPGPYVSGVVQLGTVFLDASKISFSLGKTSAAMANGQIVTGILDHFPTRQARCYRTSVPFKTLTKTGLS